MNISFDTIRYRTESSRMNFGKAFSHNGKCRTKFGGRSGFGTDESRIESIHIPCMFPDVSDRDKLILY